MAVYGTDSQFSQCEDFLGSVESTPSAHIEPPHNASVYNEKADLPTSSTYTLKQPHPIGCVPILLRPSAVNNDFKIVFEY